MKLNKLFHLLTFHFFTSLTDFQITNRANADVFLDKKSNPEKREKYQQQNGENNPAGGRNFSFDVRQILRAAARAAIAVRHRGRLLISQRLRLRRVKIRQRLDAVDFLRPALLLLLPRVLHLKFIGFPTVRLRRIIFVRFILLWLLLLLRRRLCRLSGNHPRAAETTEIAPVIIDLPAILTLNHSDFSNPQFMLC